jgi:hypothetical protein
VLHTEWVALSLPAELLEAGFASVIFMLMIKPRNVPFPRQEPDKTRHENKHERFQEVLI